MFKETVGLNFQVLWNGLGFIFIVIKELKSVTLSDRLNVDGVGRMGEEVKARCKTGHIRGDPGEGIYFQNFKVLHNLQQLSSSQFWGGWVSANSRFLQ